ncbi:hypothetical protein FH972_022847 [Carpinus fangiana]|uniref:DUF676 domain-containing protein n=1 Tax=Carpinus fangiana TaxID=176857 RepID=A0A5N6KTU0_9ROSI|nr:hypothetical protein FH972_022847 [Carpinus fangiana]
MDKKAPLPADDDDNASLTTSLPGLSPTASIASTAAMNMHDHAVESDEPPPYSAAVAQPALVPPPLPQQPRAAPSNDATQQWSSRDPRSSSTYSLVPEERAHDDRRRRLLLVYLHGFMGNETSFQSFPAHVHNLISVLLAETHVVHTKIYPRYRSRRVIAAAAEDFSAWLTPHEGPNTDTVLLGHSMGGLVSAEVVLLHSHITQANQGPLRHRILGNLNFDVPFLGMHPGIIGSGLSSIFRPAPSPPGSPAASLAPSNAASQSSLNLTPTSSISSSMQEIPTDPNYNPSFPNDVRLPQRTGWQNAAHFITKHSKNLRQATMQVINQHIEFGSCMYDFEGLKVRYSRVRMLEDESEQARSTVVHTQGTTPRVRFANYYTASTGRPKKPKKTPDDESSVTKERVAESVVSDSAPTVMTEVDPIIYEEPIPFDTASLPPDYSDIDFTSDSESGDLDALDDLDPIETPSRSDTGFSDLSSETSERPSSPLEMPIPQLPIPPIFKPPVKPPFTKEAYKSAVKTYKHEVHDYHRAIKTYHGELQAYRKQEVRRFKAVRKKSMDSLASSIDSRKTDILARHEQRKQDFNARRAELNARVEKAKESRKQLIEMVKSRGTKVDPAALSAPSCIEATVAWHTLKADRKTLKSMDRGERKAARAIEKGERRKAKSEAKLLRKGTSTSSRSVASSSAAGDDRNASQLFWDQDQQGKGDAASTLQRSSSDASSSPQPPPTREPPPLPIRSASVATTVASREPADDNTKDKTKDEKPKKDRKFCMLPPKGANGVHDPTWVRVYMENMDEVGAHCGLFFPRGPDGNERSDSDVLEAGAIAEGSWSERYAKLVGDVAERIEGWVLEDMTMRMVMAGDEAY